VSLENLLELSVFLVLGGSGYYFFKKGFSFHGSIVNIGRDVSFQSIAINYAVGSGLVFAAMLAFAGFVDKVHNWELGSIIGSAGLSIALGLIVLIGCRVHLAGR
jgi:hypothetical protein